MQNNWRKNMRRLAVIVSVAVLAAGVSACGSRDDGAPVANESAVANGGVADNTVAETPVNEPLDTQAFVDAVAANDRFVIEASQLALDKSRSDAVRVFARTMIVAHQHADAALKAAAAKALPAIHVVATLSDALHIRLDALKPESGDAFDRAYLGEQITLHEQMNTTLRNYAVGGEVDSLKSFAAETAPTEAAHLARARTIGS
jgi:putative membrane protein